MPDIETPGRLLAENLNNSYFAENLNGSFFAENWATKTLFTSIPKVVISIASGVLRPASSSELQRKDLYAEHLRRNSKYLREYSFKKSNFNRFTICTSRVDVLSQ